MIFSVQCRLSKITNRYIPNSLLRAILKQEWTLNIGNFSRIRSLILLTKKRNVRMIL
jgi:hypothetical protein